MKKVILFGAGGYSDNIRIILSNRNDIEIVGYLDERKEGEYHGLEILGARIEDIEDCENYCYFVCIGDIEDRKRIYDNINEKGLEIINVISEYAYISKDAKIGHGNYIAPGAKVLADVEIGDNNYIGTSAIVEHGCRIGNSCRISSNSTLNGETVVKDEVFFGSGAISKECITIGERSIVGGGAVAINDVQEYSTVVGIPAKAIRKKHREKLIIIGAGQQGRNCKRLAEELLIDVIAFIDDNVTGDVEGVPVFKKERMSKYRKDYKYIVAIGDMYARRKYINEIERLGLECINLIDPTAIIEDGAKIGVGNYIYKGAIIYASATIGNHCIINSGSLLATDCVVEDNCDIRFGAQICGACHIGNDTRIGYNATVSSGHNVGKYAEVEANSVVYTDILDYERVGGVLR